MTIKNKNFWEMTCGEFIEFSLSINRYSNEYKKDQELLKDYYIQKTNDWKREVESAGKDNVIPDSVIDDYVSIYGEDVLKRVFRGVREKGISQWEPKDIRIYDLTYKEFLKTNSTMIRIGHKREFHRKAIKKAIAQNKIIPNRVINSYPELSIH